MKIDVIVSWPNNCDYPLWRQFIRENRERFNEVFVVFTQTHQSPDYVDFVKRAMHADRVNFITAPPPTTEDDDWRNLAVNAALQLSTADWVWFTEQDFFIEPAYFEQITKMYFEVAAAFDAQRMHPCSILAYRPVIDETSKNFGIVRDRSDHFSIFQRELQENGVKVYSLSKDRYFHFNGLSSNCTLLQNGLQPNYKPEVFTKYLDDCLKSTVPLDPRFIEMATRFLRE